MLYVRFILMVIAANALWYWHRLWGRHDPRGPFGDHG